MVNRALALVLCVLGIVAAVALYYADVGPPKPATPATGLVPREESCGPRCVWISLQRLGCPADWSDLQKDFKDGTNAGTTLSDLSESATVHRWCKTRVDQLSWDQLLTIDGVAVLFVDGNHFVAVDPTERPTTSSPDAGEQIRVYDSELPATWVDRDALEARWNGSALVMKPLAGATSPAKEGPAVSIRSLFQDAGMLDELEASYTTKIKNTGNAPLELSVLGTSCECSRTALNTSQVLPGEEAQLDTVIDLAKKEGRYFGSVLLSTNDPDRSVVNLTYCGSVFRSRLLSTQKIDLGNVAPGAVRHRSVVVHDPGDGTLKVKNITCSCRDASGSSVTGPTCSFKVVDELHRGDSQSSSHGIGPFDLPFELTYEVPADCDEGPFIHNCTFETNVRDVGPLTLIVLGNVLPDFTSTPAALVLESDSAKDDVSGEVLLSSRSGRKLGEIKVTPTGPFTVSSIESVQEGVRVSVTATDEGGDRKYIEGSLACEEKGPRGYRVTIPILCSRKNGAD